MSNTAAIRSNYLALDISAAIPLLQVLISLYTLYPTPPSSVFMRHVPCFRSTTTSLSLHGKLETAMVGIYNRLPSQGFVHGVHSDARALSASIPCLLHFCKCNLYLFVCHFSIFGLSSSVICFYQAI
jgi:hypothetical protein